YPSAPQSSKHTAGVFGCIRVIPVTRSFASRCRSQSTVVLEPWPHRLFSLSTIKRPCATLWARCCECLVIESKRMTQQTAFFSLSQALVPAALLPTCGCWVWMVLSWFASLHAVGFDCRWCSFLVMPTCQWRLLP